MSAVGQFLYDWQTLIAGVTATIAALITVQMIRQQIKLQKLQIDAEKERHSDARRSKAWAARAEMPDALNAICNYTDRCMAFLLDENAGLPRRPSEAMSAIKSGIEFLDPQSAEKLFQLVVHYQIHNARLSDLNRRVPNELDQRMYDTAKLRALANGLFEFARNQIDIVPDTPIGRDDMLTAFRSCIGLNEYFNRRDRFAGAVGLIELWHKA